MPWIVLLVSAVLEAVWATALGMSDGLSELAPTVVFFVAVVLSTLGLGHAARHIPIGTAYAVWTGVGAALTVSYAMATGTESVSVGKVIFISGIIAAVIGLKLVPAGSPADADGAPAASSDDAQEDSGPASAVGSTPASATSSDDAPPTPSGPASP